MSATFSDNEIDVERQENEALTLLLKEEGVSDPGTIALPSSSQNPHHTASSRTSVNGVQ